MTAIQDLIDEHRCIEKILNALEKDAANINVPQGKKFEEVVKKGGKKTKITEIVQEDTPRINYIIELITDLVEKIHHGKEENLLFPLMAKYGFKSDAPPINFLLEEHDKGRKYVKAMNSAMEYWEEKPNPVIENAKQYVNLIRQHIKKEDALLKAWSKKLKQEDQVKLLQKCRELELIVVKQGRKAECFAAAENL
jgi:hemerythrin-like domain-containing protein